MKHNLSPRIRRVGPPDGAGNFASGTAVVVPPDRTLVCFSTPGFSAVLTGTYRNNTSIQMPPFPGIYNFIPFDGEVFQYVTPSGADQYTLWFLIPRTDQFPASPTVVKLQGNQTIIETEGGASATSGTGGTINSGTNVIPVGALVQYTLGMTAFSFATGATGYIAIRGATSGNYYAIILGGTTITGSFVMPQAEKLNTIFVNSSGVVQSVSYAWQATTP